MASPSALAIGAVPSVPLCLGSILSQLPPQLFGANNKAELASVRISIPGDLVLPQLATGKISVTVADLIPLLPASLLQQPLQITSDQQRIVLPLAEIIASIPPDILALQHESAISTDAPEFNELPELFDNSLLQDSSVPAEPVAEEIPATAHSDLAPISEEVPLLSVETPVATADSTCPESTSDIPQHVMVSLRSVVSAMPDRVLACPRSELWRKADFDLQVQVAVERILPQLRAARLELPLSEVVKLLPPSLLANPLPRLEGETVRMPLEEIVPQLPARLFTTLRSDSEVQEFEVTDTDIPAPFQEKGQKAVEAPWGASAVPPQPDVTEVTPPVLPVEGPALNEEVLEVFTEKPAAVESPQQEPLEPVGATPSDANQPQPVEPAAEQASVPAVPAISGEPSAQPVEPVAEQANVPAVPAVSSEPSPRPVAESSDSSEAKFLIDLNRCSVEDLQTIQGVGPALAKRIIEFRNAKGRFASLEELRQIPGIGRKTFRALAGAEPRALNRLLGVEHNHELSLQEIVRLTSKLPGVEGCMLAMSDGLFLTGELPPRLDRETISVFAPQLFKKVGRYARELRVGQIRRFTIFTDQQPLSIFRGGEVYLVVIHDTRHFSKALLRRCERISEEIAHLCRQRAVV